MRLPIGNALVKEEQLTQNVSKHDLKKASSEKFSRHVLYTPVVSQCFPWRINNYIFHTFRPP